jgi:hypothetical protein
MAPVTYDKEIAASRDCGGSLFPMVGRSTFSIGSRKSLFVRSVENKSLTECSPFP